MCVLGFGAPFWAVQGCDYRKLPLKNALWILSIGFPFGMMFFLKLFPSLKAVGLWLPASGEFPSDSFGQGPGSSLSEFLDFKHVG